MHLATQFNKFYEITPPSVHTSIFNDADYLAIMCHEIGTPLSSIIGLSHILTDVACCPQKKTECAEMLRDSSHMLMSLIKNMLDAAKINAGMIEIEDINFNLVKLVQEAMHIVANKALEKGLDLQLHITDNLPPQWLGDPLRISQILVNLLSNAVKFTENGHVSLNVSTTPDNHGNDQLCFTVADTGIGMHKDALGRIFNKYTQANASISRQHGGSGLGLSISQELARLMRGNIAVKSWPGIGSQFIVTLPLKKAAALLAAA